MVLSSLSWFHHYVTLPEVLWTLFGIVGFYFSYHNFAEAGRELDALVGREEATDPVLVAIATGHSRTEGFRMLIHSVSIIVGVTAMLSPPVSTAQPISPVAVIVTVGLFTINAITILQSVLDKRLRTAIDRLSVQDRPKGGD